MAGENQQVDVIRIQVGRKLIDDPNKANTPVPDFWFDRPFVVEVEWVDPAEELELTLSDFGLVAFDPSADYNEGEVIWPLDPDFTLELQSDEGTTIRSVIFRRSEAQKDGRGLYVTAKMLTLAKRGTRSGDPRNQLVLFRKTVSDESGVLFEIDPPWVGKPPVG